MSSFVKQYTNEIKNELKVYDITNYFKSLGTSYYSDFKYNNKTYNKLDISNADGYSSFFKNILSKRDIIAAKNETFFRNNNVSFYTSSWDKNIYFYLIDDTKYGQYNFYQYFAIVKYSNYLGIIGTGSSLDTANETMNIVGTLYPFEIMTDLNYTVISESFGNVSTTDGYSSGSFDDTSDTIPIPDLPTVGYVENGGLAYHLTSNELQSLVNELFAQYTPLESADTALEKIGIMLENVSNTLVQLLNSQFVQFVTDVHCVPCEPTCSGVENIKLGSRTMTTTADRILSSYVEIDCGTLNIQEYYTNFLDYLGTICKLYLPFVGFVDIKNEWFQSGYINVIYHYNIIDGTFMAFIKCSSSKSNLKDSVVASYGGSCCVHLPFVGADYSNVISGIVSTVNGATSLVGSGNMVGAVDSAVNMLSNIGGTVNGSNEYNSNSAFLGIRTPYLYIERVVSDFSENYTNEVGLPLNVTYKLGDITGYSEILNIHLDDLNCTESEKNNIVEMLKNGVIL